MEETRGYVRIANTGEIDSKAFTLIGATNKRGTNKIGYFGSGLKYALAVLLRDEIKFRVFSGTKEIKFTKKVSSFRGVPIQIIHVDGKATNMTTDMGPDWLTWFAVRELYCNALDEGECNLGISNAPTGEVGKTIVYVEFNPEIKDLFNNWDRYFSNKRKDVVLKINDSNQDSVIFSGRPSELVLYRRGVQVHEQKTQKSLFHYDLSWIKINESRVASDMWQVQTKIPELLAHHATLDMISEIFNNYSKSFEADLYWNYATPKFNDFWLQAINNRSLVRHDMSGFFVEQIISGEALVLPSVLVSALKTYFPQIKVLGKVHNEDRGYVIGITEKQQIMLDNVLAFFKRGDIVIEHPVQIFAFENKRILGEAKDGKILLSPLAFLDGRRTLARVVLEEAAHLESGMPDETRGFQNYLFGQILNLLEEKVKDVL